VHDRQDKRGKISECARALRPDQVNKALSSRFYDASDFMSHYPYGYGVRGHYEME